MDTNKGRRQNEPDEVKRGRILAVIAQYGPNQSHRSIARRAGVSRGLVWKMANEDLIPRTDNRPLPALNPVHW